MKINAVSGVNFKENPAQPAGQNPTQPIDLARAGKYTMANSATTQKAPEKKGVVGKVIAVIIALAVLAAAGLGIASANGFKKVVAEEGKALTSSQKLKNFFVSIGDEVASWFGKGPKAAAKKATEGTKAATEAAGEAGSKAAGESAGEAGAKATTEAAAEGVEEAAKKAAEDATKAV
jgi:hypothetical protein